MFRDKVINIDFDAIEKAIKITENPVVVMNNDTLYSFMGLEDPRSKLVNINDEEVIYTFCNVPISINLSLDYGEVVVK